MSERFHVVDINPNDSTGGGGCLCSETETPDSKGPFVVFPFQEMSSNISPHAVLCAGCVCAAAKAVEGETLSGGEATPELVQGVLVPDDRADEPAVEIPEV